MSHDPALLTTVGLTLGFHSELLAKPSMPRVAIEI